MRWWHVLKKAVILYYMCYSLIKQIQWVLRKLCIRLWKIFLSSYPFFFKAKIHRRLIILRKKKQFWHLYFDQEVKVTITNRKLTGKIHLSRRLKFSADGWECRQRPLTQIHEHSNGCRIPGLAARSKIPRTRSQQAAECRCLYISDVFSSFFFTPQTLPPTFSLLKAYTRIQS